MGKYMVCEQGHPGTCQRASVKSSCWPVPKNRSVLVNTINTNEIQSLNGRWAYSMGKCMVILAPAKEHLAKAAVDLFPRTETFWKLLSFTDHSTNDKKLINGRRAYIMGKSLVCEQGHPSTCQRAPVKRSCWPLPKDRNVLVNSDLGKGKVW